jgi:DNA-binding NarL/FixJ family response regulator
LFESRNHLLVESEPAWQQFIDALDDFLPASSTTPSIGDLTSREREVLEYIALGLDNSRISAQLKISEMTVRNHVSIIFGKLGVNTRAQAVALARDAGLGRRLMM